MPDLSVSVPVRVSFPLADTVPFPSRVAGSTSASAPIDPLPVLPSPTPSGLADIARVLAQRDGVWASLVRFDPAERFVTRIAAERGWEAWLLTWLPGQSTGLHDHGGSAGAFVTLQGILDEVAVTPRRAGPGQRSVRTRVTARQVRSFGRHHVHNVVNSGSVPAVSLHVYAPVLASMTRYELRDGRLQVTSRERAGQDW
jgi:hypothetical protein